MKTKFTKLSLGVTASVAMLAAIPAAHAQESTLGDLSGYVVDPFGGFVKDPFGECVRTPFWTGEYVPVECGGAQPVAKVEAPPAPTIETISLSADAYFDFDKSTLKPAGRAALDELAGKMRRATTITSILVVGNTDSIGTDAYNQRLSERRADSVRDYLVDKGVNPSLISTRGDGERNPIAPNQINGRDNPQGRAQNRRVDITVEAKEQVMR